MRKHNMQDKKRNFRTKEKMGYSKEMRMMRNLVGNGRLYE